MHAERRNNWKLFFIQFNTEIKLGYAVLIPCQSTQVQLVSYISNVHCVWFLAVTCTLTTTYETKVTHNVVCVAFEGSNEKYSEYSVLNIYRR